MKITAIRPITVHAGDRNWVFVRVETDQPGLYGWGEGTLEWKTRAVVGCVEDFVPMLLGRDPRDISWLHERMVKHSFWPLGVIGLTAVSAIEQALWDILGKDCGKPVWQLLGGRARERVRVYAHISSSKRDLRRRPLDPEAYADGAREMVAKGYNALKCGPAPYTHYATDRDGVRRMERLAVMLREAVGPDVDLLFDFHGRASTIGAAVAYTKALAACDPMFVEEPVQPGDPDAMRVVDVTMKAEAREQVTTPAGTFQTIRVQPTAGAGVVKNRGNIWIWYTDDQRHMPVQMRARLFWGTITMRLVSMASK